MSNRGTADISTLQCMINESPLSGAERVPAAIRQTFVQVVPSLAVPGLGRLRSGACDLAGRNDMAKWSAVGIRVAGSSATPLFRRQATGSTGYLVAMTI